MRFWKFLLLLSMLWALPVMAQTTAVSATVVDSNTTTWINGTWTMQFVPNPSQPNILLYNIAGVPLDPAVTTQTGTMNGSGVLSATVYQNGVITPVGSQWRLTVCPLASSKCGFLVFIAAGGSMDLSTSLTAAIPPPSFNAVAGSYGYADVEAQITLPVGATYWNTTSNTQRFYNGSAWVDGTVGGPFCALGGCTMTGNIAAPPALPLPYSTCTVWGDSLTCGVGAGPGSCSIYTLGTNTFPSQLQALAPSCTVLNRGIPSQTTSDVMIRMGMCPNGGPSYNPGACVATLTSPLGTAAGSTATFTVPGGVLGYRACAFSPSVGIPVVINGIPGTCVDTSGTGLGTYTFTSTSTSAGLANGTYNYNGNPPASELAGLNLIWAGTNNVFRPPTIIADMSTIVAGLPNGSHYSVITPLNRNALDGWIGNKDNNTNILIAEVEQQQYPGHSLEVRERLVKQGNHNDGGLAQTDFLQDVTPYTLRGQYAPGTLVADITDTTSCTFTVNGTPTPLEGYVTLFDSEYIYTINYPGVTTSDCIRGYGKSTAATHTAGATATSWDAVHLNSTGYGDIAAWTYAWMQSDAGATSAFLAPTQTLQNYKTATGSTQPTAFATRYAFTINGFGDTFNYKAGNNAAHSLYSGGGVNNTIVGPFALYDSTSSNLNTVFGVRAGEHLTTSSNTIFGTFAGQKLADNTTNAVSVSNAVLFGRSTRILGSNDTDTGAFGDAAITCGTHCYTFGGPNATKVYAGQSTTTVGQPPVATASIYGVNLNLSGTNCSTGVVKGDGSGCVNPITTISMASAPGDLICAVGTSNSIPDTTIGQTAITAMSSDASTVTLTSAGFLGYRVGATINTAVTGTPAGLSGPFVIASITPVGSQTSMVLTSATNPCSGGSCSGVGGTINEICSNSADATTFTSFANNYLNFPVSANTYAELKAMLGVYSPSVSPAPVNFHLLYNGTTVYANNTVFTPLTQSGLTPAYASMGWSEMGLSSTSAVFVPSEFVFPTASSAFLTGSRAAYGSISGLTSGLPVTFQVQFQATAVYSGTYTSGGSITGTVGQTCNLASFNNGSTATATVALTGTNVIAGGTALTITARGTAATAAPTTATLSSGTATCSGTATLATVLGAASGNAVKVFAFGRTQ